MKLPQEMPQQELAKISVPLEPGKWGQLKTESLWAEPVSAGLYRVANSPFFAYGISVGDTVMARMIDGTLTFTGIAKRGGHSTYRLLLREGLSYEAPEFLEYWRPLERIGCAFESAGKTWIAVDVAPDADIDEVRSFLDKGHEDGVWSTDEGYSGYFVEPH